MTDQEFDTMIYIKVRGIVRELMAQRKMHFLAALRYLYGSKLYADFLCDEATKTWHISTTRLLYYLEMEKQHKSITFLADEL
ncbi:MAG: hypothetical protein ACRC46_13950 [Thermoguttaceae bacterium]